MKSQRPKSMASLKPIKTGKKKIFFYQVLFSFLIFLTIASVMESKNPWSKSVKGAAKKLFSWHINYSPDINGALKKILSREEWLEFSWIKDKKEEVSPAMVETIKDQYMVIPVSGKILKQFGWHKDSVDGLERYNEGLNIQAPLDTPIKAAYSGTVKKIGQDAVLGKYLILEHSGDYLSLYAHCSEILVKEDQVIRIGEEIAQVGTSGAIKEPQLHFEVREKGKLVDPISKFKFNKGI